MAVLELDPKYTAPTTARVLRLMEEGSYKQVFEGAITPSTPWLRYVYSKFDFTPVNDPGLYVIEYADQRTAPFPISKDAYSNIWQDSLDDHTLPSRWITFPFAKATACGTALRTWMSLALAYREFNLKYDELTVDETAREVEMHRPDGVPDTVQQVKHGALLISCGLRMKPSWPGPPAGLWPATLRTRSFKERK